MDQFMSSGCLSLCSMDNSTHSLYSYLVKPVIWGSLVSHRPVCFNIQWTMIRVSLTKSGIFFILPFNYPYNQWLYLLTLLQNQTLGYMLIDDHVDTAPFGDNHQIMHALLIMDTQDKQGQPKVGPLLLLGQLYSLEWISDCCKTTCHVRKFILILIGITLLVKNG